jgi:hypothetical protein
MLLECGDCYERLNVDWIRSTLPEYEHIWSRFIGHDGAGQLLPLKNLPQELATKRKAFSQAHYTTLICLLQLRDICDEFRKHQGEVQNSDNFLKTHRTITVFMSYLGQIRDMCKRMDEALDLNHKTWPRLNEFYEKRNHYLHGPIPLHQLEDGLLKMADLAGSIKSCCTWDDKKLWTEAPQLTFTFVSDFLATTFTELIPLVRAALSDFLTAIKALENTHNLSLEGPLVFTNIEREAAFEMTAGSSVYRVYKDHNRSSP